jgi:hypothetical protein
MDHPVNQETPRVCGQSAGNPASNPTTSDGPLAPADADSSTRKDKTPRPNHQQILTRPAIHPAR